MPEAVLLMWRATSSTFELERSDNDGASWTALDQAWDYDGDGSADGAFVDRSVSQGQTLFYRARLDAASDWLYLGNTVVGAGDAVTTPVWSAPRPVPIFESVEWHCPDGASKFLCPGTVTLRLDPEPGETLDGAAIRLFLNEDTFDATDRFGDPIPIVTPDPYPFSGRDEPACVTRKATPDLEFTAHDGIVVSIPNVHYGANSFRFEVDDGQGGFSERALLYGLHDTVGGYDATYDTLQPLLYSFYRMTESFALKGLGPVNMRSPDCADGDGRQPYPNNLSVYNAKIGWWYEIANQWWYFRVATDGSGRWSMGYSGPDQPVSPSSIPIQNYACAPSQAGHVGRSILADDGVPITGLETAQQVCGEGSSSYSFYVDTTLLGPHPPELVYTPESGFSITDDEIVDVWVRFGIHDLGHDVIIEDPREVDIETITSVTVTNTTLDPAQKAYAWYADGGVGEFVAEVPMWLPEGSTIYPNELEIHALDVAGNEMTETITVTRKPPTVVSMITSADPPPGVPDEPVTRDGSASIVPDLGLEEGGVAQWACFSRRPEDSTWTPYDHTELLTGPEELVMSIPMPQERLLKARLVVADHEDNFPDWIFVEERNEIPCHWYEDGNCDTAEIVIEMADPDCYSSPGPLVVDVVEPAAETIEVGVFEELTLEAFADAGGDSVAYRWVVYDAQYGIGSPPVAYLGYGENGWSELNQQLIVTPSGQGLPAGNYLLVAEARSPALGCMDPEVDGWASGASSSKALNVIPAVHTIDGVAPGQVVEGGTFRVYSSTWTEGADGYVFIDDVHGDDVDPIIYYGTVQLGGYLEITPLPGELSDIGAEWLVSVADDAEGAMRSSDAKLQIQTPGTTEVPNIVLDEEGTTCGQGGASVNGECAHPILPGQIWQGEWGEAGDTDYFTYVAGAGTEVRITLDGADASLPPQHPATPMPEILVARPDGLVFAVSDPLLLGATGTSVDATLSMDGRHFVIARTPTGSGTYLVKLEKLADGGTGAPAFGYTKSMAYLATSSSPTAWFKAPVIDGFGNPISGATVGWEEGADCGDGSFCGNGTIVVRHSNVDALVEYFPATRLGVLHLWQASANLPVTAAPTKVTAAGASGLELRKSIKDDPILGRLRFDGLAVFGAELPDLETAHAIREQYRLLARITGAKEAKDGLNCNAAEPTCPDSNAPVFSAAQLYLDPGDELVDVRLEILADGQAIYALDGEEVVTGVPLTVEATVCIQNESGIECDIPIDEPVAVLVTSDFGAVLEQGGLSCNLIAATPGAMTYWVGRTAIMNFNHIDENGDPCCWLPLEWIDAVVVANVMIDDGQGGFIPVSKRAETTVESTPRPAAACEIRPYPPGPYLAGMPEIGAMGPRPLAAGETSTWQNVGSVYAVDACGNLEYPGVNDEQMSVVGTVPDDPEIWTELVHSEGHWEWQMYLHSTHSFTDEHGNELFEIPSGTYTADLAVDGAPECTGGTVTYGHTVDYALQPVIQLVWMQEGTEPATPVAAPGSALRHDETGEVIAWRVRPADSVSGWNGGSIIYSDVPVRLFVAENVVTFDIDGNVREMMRKVDGAELCVGEVHKYFDPNTYPAPGSDVTTITCDPIGVGETEVSAYTEPEWWTGGVFDGPIGLAAGVVVAPGQAGTYYLVAEPLDDSFSRDDSWRIAQDWCSAETGSCIGTYRKDFDVVDREPPTDNSCSPCEACAGGDIVLRNGNVRHFDADPLPGLPAPLAGRTCDSRNTEDGVFGTCWTSAYDSGAAAGATKVARIPGLAKVATIDEVRLTTEDNRSFIFQSIDGGAFFQSWPEGGPRSRLIEDGADYVLELSGNPYRRTYRGSDGRLVRLEEIDTGRAYTIGYAGATGAPTEVTDSWRGVIATFDVVSGHVVGVTTPAGTVGFGYGGDATLDTVTAAGVTWRTYGYSGDDQLTEITDGAGHLVDTYSYADGLAASSISAGDSITAVEWGAAGPRPVVGDERIVRTDSATGASTYYYLRRIAGTHRVVEIVGECACSGNDRIYAYDALGNLAAQQDGRGYITRHEYLGDGRKNLDETGLRPSWCDPEDFPENPAACRLTVDELEALQPGDLEPTDTSQIQWYAYGDTSWPDRPTQVCSSSVLQLPGESDRVACRSTTYDPDTGQSLSSTESGWTGQSAEEAVLESRTTTRTFYGGGSTAPAFDPGGAFDPLWLAQPQPDNLVFSVDGPRDDVADVVSFVYYPVIEIPEAPVPIDWRGRLAAQMDAEGHITRYQDYDEWGNARRIIGPTGIVTELAYDDLGRLLTRTLVGGEGCSPIDDPLCTTDLVTTSTYLPGGGPLESVTSPGGTVTEYAYDDFGRMLTTDRGPAAGAMLERMENDYDPVTGLRVSDSRLAYEAGSGWVEHSRTDYQHYLTGQLVLVERPRFEGDPTPSEEHYSYDVAGRIATVQDPNHTAPNVEYIYDPLGRLDRVRQLLDPVAPPDERWAETSYGYDSNGNLVAVTDANGNLTEYLVDDFGQTVRITSPVTGVTEMAYDAGGNLTTRLDARGVTATSVYDADGRLSGITYDDGVTTEALSFEYDAAGRRTRAESSEVVQTFTHSRRGLVLTATQEVAGTSRETSYRFNLDGQLESVNYPSGRTVDYGVDFAGRPTAIDSTAPGAGAPVTVADNLEYLPFGPATHLELGPPAGRLKETRGHDWHYRRTTQQLIDAAPTTLLDLDFDYDPAGNLVVVTDHQGDRSAGYDYDDLGRLTGVTWADANRVFDYDPIGNLERIGVDEGLTGEGEVLLGFFGNPEGNNSPVLASTETYQGGTPLSSYTVVSDDVGNVTSDGLTSLSYGLENHLADRQLNATTLDYVYTPDGRLIRSERSDTGAVTEIVLDIAGRRLAKLENGVWRDYVYLGDQLLAYFDDGAAEPTQVIADHIGMPMMAVDATGAVVWQAKAESYGELRGEVGLRADPGLRYPGQWQDELELEASCVGDTCTMPGPLEDSFSLFENGYRWYKPGWGRYGQADPIGLDGGAHLFTYAANNSLRYVDDSGLAYFARRPLQGAFWIPGISCFPLFDLFNLEASHEQLFFTDGEHPGDLGFMGDGTVRQDNPRFRDDYRCRSGNYNDCLMRKAVFNVGTPTSYCLIGQNCQDWAGAVRREYWDLAGKEWELEDCGLECAPKSFWAWLD